MKVYFKPFIIALAIILFAGNAFGGKEKINARLSGSSFVIASAMAAEDDKTPTYEYTSLTPVFSRYLVQKSTGVITFGLNEFSSKVLNSNYAAQVTINVQAFNKQGNMIGGFPTTLILDINYNTAGTYKDKAVFAINGAHKVIVIVNDIKVNNVSVTNPNTTYDLFLESEIQTDRFYEMDYNAATQAPFLTGISKFLNTTTNELEIKWPIVKGAEEYELEYIHVNDYSGVTVSGVLSAASLQYTFRNNGTRIRLKDNNYKMSMAFERGYILYRIRPIGRSMSNITIEEFGKWSADNLEPVNANLGTFIGTPAHANQFYYITPSSNIDHENNKNWQYSTTFAEDGKKKEVISYFDGSLRTRQSVTKINSDKNVLVGETFYDHQGRAAVDALPVPTKNLDNNIKYYENFNLSDNNVTANSIPQNFTRKDFDLDDAGGNCPPTAKGMHLNDGASYYYSSSNPLNTQGAGAYIPLANKFPFVHKVYTPDNTGRIRSQGGVGSNYQIGTGHETKYLYGQPDQQELDRLFGSEAGFYYRYKKNQVIDPNGQISVTYLNEEGKTVATALAGNTPQSLNVLNTNALNQINVKHLKYTDSDYKFKNKEVGNSLVFEKQILPTVNGIYNFDYNVQVPVYSNICTPNLCYSCVYDLVINIIDECGGLVFSTNPVKVKIGNQSTTVPSTCPSSYVFSPVVTPALNAISPVLNAGKAYTIKKTLTIDQNVIDTYAKRYTDTTYNTCIKGIKQLVVEQSGQFDPNDCNMNCASCSTSVYQYWSTHQSIMTIAQRDILVDECMDKCKPLTPCSNNYKIMLGDMSPSGQYAKYDQTITAYNATGHALSVLNEGNSLPLNVAKAAGGCNVAPLLLNSTFANYRFPNYYNTNKHDFVKPDKNTDASIPNSTNGQVPYYFNENGSVAKIYVIADPSNPGQYIPKVLIVTNVFTETSSGKLYIYPQNLLNLKDFVSYFQPYWAHSLVAYHPEFSYFLECDKWGNNNPNYTTTFNSTQFTSDAYDAFITSISTYALASSIFPSLTGSGPTINDIVNNDPFFFHDASNATYNATSDLCLTNIKSEFLAELANYSSSGNSMIKIAAVSSRCGTRYFDCSTCTSTVTFGSNSSPSSNVPVTFYQDKEWETLKNMYLAAKYKYQMKHSHYVNKNIKSTTNNLITTPNQATTVYDIPMYNGCIGNPAFSFIASNFYWPFFDNSPLSFGFDNTGFFKKCQNCNFQTYQLYSSKLKRFIDDKDNINALAGGSDNIYDQMKAMKDKAEAEMFYSTGQCPLSLQLETFLNYLAVNNLYTTTGTKPLLEIEGFTKEIFETIHKCQFGTAPTCYVEYNANFQVVSGNMVIAINNPSPIFNTNITLIPASTISNWAQVKYISNISYLGNNQFNAIAHVQNSTNPLSPLTKINLTINAPCFNPTCSFPVVQCFPSQTANDILKALNGLVGSTDNSSNPVPLIMNSSITNVAFTMGLTANPYSISNVFTNLFLKPLFNPSAPADFNYSFNSNISTFSFGSSSNPSFQFGYTALTGPTIIDFQEIDYFISIEPDASNPNQFYVMAHLQNPFPSTSPNTSLQKIQVNVSYNNLASSTNTFVLGDCSDPLPTSCNTPKAKATLDMKKFLNEFLPTAINLTTPYTGGLTLSNFSYFTNNIQSFLPSVNTSNSSLGGLTNNSKTFIFSIGGNIDNTPCTFTISFPANSTTDFNSLVTVNKVSATQNSGELLLYVNSNNEIIKLQSSCMQFLNCNRCDEELVTAYTENFSSYNSSSSLPTYVTEVYNTPQDASTSSSNFKSIYDITSSSPVSSGALTCFQSGDPAHAKVLGFYYPAIYSTPLTVWTNNFSTPLNVVGGNWFLSFDYADCKSYDGAFEIYANNTLVSSFTLASSSWANTSQYLNLGPITLLNSLELRFVGPAPNSSNNTKPFTFLDNFSLYKKSCPKDEPTLYPPQDPSDDCVKQQKQFAKNNAFQLYKKQIDDADKDFREKFTKKCKASMEELKGNYTNQEHHYTLYYYDQAGNLIKTVPPEGVEIVNLSATLPNSSTTYEQAIEDDRVNNTHLVNTEHRMATKYEYNSLNQLINQYMPDHVNTESWNLNSKTGLPSSYQGKSVSFDPANPLLGYTVGKDASNNGQLFKTTDGGQSWSAVTQIGYGNINAIAETGSFFFAVTDAGKLLIYDTNNPGWVDNTNALPNNVTGSLNDISFYPQNTQKGFIVGDNGQIYYTNNGGAIFGSYNTNAPNVKINKAIPGNGFYLFLGNNGLLMHSEFISNSIFNTPYLANTQVNAGINLTDGITFLSTFANTTTRSEAIVVGYNNGSSSGYTQSRILAIDNPNNSPSFLSGQNTIHSLYTDQTTNSKLLAATAKVTAGGITLYAAGTQGKVLLANYFPTAGPQGLNFPTNWIAYSINYPTNNPIPDVTDIAVDNNGLALAVLSDGNMLNNFNSSSPAYIQNTATQAKARTIFPGSTNNTFAFIGAENGNISMVNLPLTSNPTFILQATFNALPPLNGVAVKNGKVIAVGDNGKVIDNFNGPFGINTFGSNNFNAVAIDPTTQGVMVGNSQAITFDINQANIFNAISTSNNYVSVTSKEPGVFYALQPNGGFDKIDYSASSISNASSFSGSSYKSLFQLDANTAFAVGTGGLVKRLTKTGNSWGGLFNMSFTSSQNLNAAFFTNPSTGYVFGTNNLAKKTIDAGANWIDFSGTPGSDINATAFNSQGYAIVVGTGNSNLQEIKDKAADFNSIFLYDELGRLVISQNAKQYAKTPKAYSFTNYDALGRIVKVGEVASTIDPQTLTNYNGVIATPVYNGWLTAGAKTEITSTFYDNTVGTIPSFFVPTNLRKRVTATYIDTDDNLGNGYTFASYYSYDIHGNVQTLVNDYPEMALYSKQYSTVDYEYDLISGKVNNVIYQKNAKDQFMHEYVYDSDNRITNVLTSRDGLIWDQEAKYFYYKHGPLARTEIGNTKVQAMDYAYTLQGWIKAMNSANLAETHDMGKDGQAGSNYIPSQNNLHSYIGRDAMGYNLSYNNTDYAAINPAAITHIANIGTNPDIAVASNNLFNGNIRAMATSIQDPVNNYALKAQLSTYKYDQLNRINLSKSYTDFTPSSNSFGNGSTSILDLYKNTFTYDGNGNIINQTKSDQAGNQIDGMTYNYHKDANGKMVNNRLYHVNDTQGPNASTTDIDDQGNFTQAGNNSSSLINANNNYSYDQIGNLVKDVQEKIIDIKWTVYGKIQSITKFIPGANNLNTQVDIAFDYDPAGNRVKKSTLVTSTIAVNATNLSSNVTYYQRDAQGNVMVNYNTNSAFIGIVPQEFHVYGSSRVGMLTNTDDLASINFNPLATTYSSKHIKGARNYELSNHLGNVLTVVSDRSIPVAQTSNPNLLDYRRPEILSTSDFYAFGSIQGGRNYNSNSYRFGFNGKENDNEVKGFGNSVDFGDRISDTRLGKFLSIDRLSKKYLAFSPYSFTANNPIIFVEVNGQYFDWSKVSPEQRKKIESTFLELTNTSKLFKEVYRQLNESDKPYVIEVGLTFKRPEGGYVNGLFRPNKETGGGAIKYLDENKASDLFTTTEEVFHAYQNDVSSVYDEKLPHNLEAEAKLFVNMVLNETGELPNAPMINAQEFFDYLGENFLGESVPLEKIKGKEFQEMYMNTTDKFSKAYKGSGYPTYEAENKQGPKAIEKAAEGAEKNAKKDE